MYLGAPTEVVGSRPVDFHARLSSPVGGVTGFYQPEMVRRGLTTSLLIESAASV